MDAIEQYLTSTGTRGFAGRRKLDRLSAGMPAGLGKPARRLIWNGPWRHMNHFDHDYRYERRGAALVEMSHRGRRVIEARPPAQLIGRIDRPVTLVTSGPSSLQHDWAALRASGRLIVAVTGGATFLQERGIVPDLLVVTDPNFSETVGYHVANAKGVPLAVEYRCAAALHAHFPGALDHRPLALIERVNKWYGAASLGDAELKRLNCEAASPYRIAERPGLERRIGWSSRLECGFFPSSTVAFVALQLIVAMGGTDIEIVGMDLGGGRSVYQDARPSKLEEQYEICILPSFQLMGEVLADTPVRIRNLSPVCPLPPEIFASPSPSRPLPTP